LENPSLDGRIILKWIVVKWDVDMNWIDLALQFHKMRRIS